MLGHLAGRRPCTGRCAIARPCSGVAPSRCAVQAIACSERHSVSASSMMPRRWKDSWASTSTAIVTSAPRRPHGIAVRPMHASSFSRRPSASASSSAQDVSLQPRLVGRPAVGVEAHLALDAVVADHAPERAGAADPHLAAGDLRRDRAQPLLVAECGRAGRRATTRALAAQRGDRQLDPQRAWRSTRDIAAPVSAASGRALDCVTPAGVAQLVEQRFCKPQARGSSPLSGSTSGGGGCARRAGRPSGAAARRS